MEKYTYISVMLAVAILCLPQILHAEEELAPGYNACMDAAVSNVDMRHCVGMAHEYWEKILSQNYKKQESACVQDESPGECKKNF